jgi:hypothetical protein
LALAVAILRTPQIRSWQEPSRCFYSLPPPSAIGCSPSLSTHARVSCNSPAIAVPNSSSTNSRFRWQRGWRPLPRSGDGELSLVRAGQVAEMEVIAARLERCGEQGWRDRDGRSRLFVPSMGRCR